MINWNSATEFKKDLQSIPVKKQETVFVYTRDLSKKINREGRQSKKENCLHHSDKFKALLHPSHVDTKSTNSALICYLFPKRGNPADRFAQGKSSLLSQLSNSLFQEASSSPWGGYNRRPEIVHSCTAIVFGVSCCSITLSRSYILISCVS